MNTELNNTVIECLDLEHGQEIKAIFIKNGVDVGNYLFTNTKESNYLYRYYGVLNGKFSNYSIEQVKAAGARIVELPPEEIEQPRCELVPDFKVGDTVYSMTSDKGCIEFKITNIVNDDKYPIKTVIENGVVHDFTLDGKRDINHNIPCLSHTPYDFVNGGFSQRMKRVLPDIPVDTLVYVKGSLNEWEMRYLS